MTSYVSNLPYGNLILNILPKVPPTILWLYFVYQYYYPYIKKQSLHMSLVMFLIYNSSHYHCVPSATCSSTYFDK